MTKFLREWRCGRIRSRLVDLAEGDLSGRARARVERHVAGCEPCREDLEGLRKASGLLRASLDLPGEDGSEEVWDRQREAILDTIRRQRAPRKASRPRSAVPWSAGLAVATAAMIAVIGAWHFQEVFRPSIQFAEIDEPVASDIDALEAGTVIALVDVAAVIAPPDGEEFGIENLSESDLEMLDAWLGHDLG